MARLRQTLGPTSTFLARNSTNFARFRLKFSRSRSKLTRIRRILTDFGRTWSTLNHFRARFGQLWSMSCPNSTTLCRHRAIFDANYMWHREPPIVLKGRRCQRSFARIIRPLALHMSRDRSAERSITAAFAGTLELPLSTGDALQAHSIPPLVGPMFTLGPVVPAFAAGWQAAQAASRSLWVRCPSLAAVVPNFVEIEPSPIEPEPHLIDSGPNPSRTRRTAVQHRSNSGQL